MYATLKLHAGQKRSRVNTTPTNATNQLQVTLASSHQTNKRTAIHKPNTKKHKLRKLRNRTTTPQLRNQRNRATTPTDANTRNSSNATFIYAHSPHLEKNHPTGTTSITKQTTPPKTKLAPSYLYHSQRSSHTKMQSHIRFCLQPISL